MSNAEQVSSDSDTREPFSGKVSSAIKEDLTKFFRHYEMLASGLGFTSRKQDVLDMVLREGLAALWAKYPTPTADDLNGPRR